MYYIYILFSDVDMPDADSELPLMPFEACSIVSGYIKDSSTFEIKFKKGTQWVPRTYVSRAKDCTATSLPLHFYFGYQLLREEYKGYEQYEESSKVKYLFIKRRIFIV